MTANRPISTGDAERLLNAEPANVGFDDLVPLVAALRLSRPPPVDSALLEGMVVEAAAIACGGEDRTAVIVPAPKRGLQLRHRVATGAAAITVVLGSGAGVAIAADGAAPGDPLYGLDRALETVAIGDGGAVERLKEAAVLVEAGHLADGLEHAAEILAANHGGESGDASEAASEALRTAAERISADSATNSVQRTAVSDVLTYLSENIEDVDGRKVAELSQLIGADARGQHQPPSTTIPPHANPPENPVPGPPTGRGNDPP